MTNYVTPVGQADVITVTLSADTSILADNDVIAATQEVTGVYRVGGGVIEMNSIMLLDKDKQTQDIDLVFLNANGSVGAENAAFSPSDAVAATIVGFHSILIANYYDATNSSLFYAGDLHKVMKAADGTTSLWVAAVCRSGTPTYTAAGLVLQLGIIRY